MRDCIAAPGGGGVAYMIVEDASDDSMRWRLDGTSFSSAGGLTAWHMFMLKGDPRKLPAELLAALKSESSCCRSFDDDIKECP